MFSGKVGIAVNYFNYSKKTVDETSNYAIMIKCYSNFTQTVVYAQYTTGGRLGVRLCQM